MVAFPAHTTIGLGTEFVDGVRYNTYPPPSAIIKIMKRCYAEYLLSEGAMHFGSCAYFKTLETPVLGDPNDGKGMLHMNGHPYNVGSMNTVYVWCASLPKITPERVNLLAKCGKYDCLVRINQPRILIQRVRLAKSKNLLLQCAEVSYNRGEEVDKATLNLQKFRFNVFQKDLRFAEDKEYRISLTDAEFRPELSYIDLHVGECSDIMEIEDLPWE